MTPRVVVLTPYFYPLIGGVESNAERFARFLSRADTTTVVLTKRLSPALPDVDERGGVAIRRIGPRGDRSAAAKWLMVPAVLWWLVRHAHRYDVVCVVDYRGVGIAALLARALTGRPVLIQGQTTGILSGVIGGNASPTESLPTRLMKWPLRRIYAQADALACISRVLQEEARAFGVPERRIHLLPNGIDMNRFAPADAADRAARRAALGFSDADVVCVFIGRLSREKGILELVQAWQRVQPARATLLIAGPDMTGSPWNCGPEARAFVESHGLQPSVRFLGATENVAGILQLADVAIQPSHFEALGLSAIEALACGVPVVASRVGGLPEFVHDDVNGRLVPPQDVDALAAALRDLIGDASARARLAAAARPSVAEYDIGVVFTRMADVLATLAERARA